MKGWHWIAAAIGVVAVILVITKRRHPVIGGTGYPMHQTTWGEAFKIAFLGTKYPEPINIKAPAGMVGAVDITTNAVTFSPEVKI